MSNLMKTPEFSVTFIGLMKNNRAKLLGTLGGGLLIFVVWQFSLIWVAQSVAPVTDLLLAKSDSLAARPEALGVFLFLTIGFGPALIVLLLWRKIMERRPTLTLFSGASRFRWLFGCAFLTGMGALAIALTFCFDASGVASIKARLLRFSALEWCILTGAYAIGIGIQATFEEVFVRGWLLQHLSRFVRHPANCVLLSALIFAALHLGSPGWATYAAAFVSGLAFGWSVFRLNGLEAAIGAHIGNNLVAALLGGGMITGNQANMSPTELLSYAIYILGFLLLVELGARAFAPKLSPA
jgi:uncharacterized protein